MGFQVAVDRGSLKKKKGWLKEDDFRQYYLGVLL